MGRRLGILPPKATSSKFHRRCWKNSSATKSCCRAFAKHYETGEVLPAEIIRKMKTAGAFGRADWVRTQLYYTTLSLDLHDQDPAQIDLDEITKRLYTSW